jgi:FrmR/RcnR family transcriptional regulator, repressor of frmRAB operon
MSHTIKDKGQLLNRARRIRGQMEAIEKGLLAERDSHELLQLVAACRGAINGLMIVLLEGHIRHHVVQPGRKATPEQKRASQEVIDVVRTYLR